MYPEAETGAKSSHPSGKYSVLPELTVLLLPSVPGRQLEFKALVLTQAVNSPRARLLVLFAILKSEETTKLKSI